MNLYPAIDILEGKAVRLVKGDFEAKKVYDEDPLSAARRWVRAGARNLHIVDLDGARAGEPRNLEHVRRIAGELDVPVQLGGGLRSAEDIAAALATGVTRVILGTAALTEPALLEWALEQHGAERVMVSVDVRGGLVTTRGWTESTTTAPERVIADLQELGVSELLYTSVDRDGMLAGPSLAEVDRVARAVTGSLIYSGGIGRLADLHGLAALGCSALSGVIVGKALYEQRFTIAEAHAALAG
jgi:phosphoribosylformimino-5-aminoimidazole carboxamide ribotide isomerase